jgi:diaminopimelate epimerase
MKLSILSAAGNAFAVLDTRCEGRPDDPAALARAVCADRGSELFASARRGGLPELPQRALDGLLLVLDDDDAHCRMEIYNADGSRSEACGNGLRCVARFAREHGWAHSDAVRIATDAGMRSVQLSGCSDRPEPGKPVGTRATMGKPRVLARAADIDVRGETVRATLVDMGNPHCVLFVEDERTAPVGVLGPALERHARFPERTNVEFTALRAGRLAVRVWERGVGETAACGTGACAAAVAAALERGVSLPVDVDLPGGRLRVHWTPGGEAELEGPALLHAEAAWAPGVHEGAR